MATRFSREHRKRDSRPSKTRSTTVTAHHGDDFDEIVANVGHLCVVPVRDYTPKVPQTFDETHPGPFGEPLGRFNQLGPVIEGAIPVVTEKSFASYMAAFDKRSNSQPDLDDDCTAKFIHDACRLWCRVPVSFEAFDVDEPLFERWLAKFDDAKQRRMRAAFLELFAVEDDSDYLGTKTLSVKIEALLKRHDKKWAPRLIYAGNDHFNALTGPIAMVLCERLVEILGSARVGPIKYVMCYKTDDVRLAAHMANSEFANVAEGDFSANDLRQRRGATVVFDEFCKKVGAPQWFRKLLMDMRVFKTVNMEFGHRSELANQLPTGTTITTPRNTVWNITIESLYAIKTGNEGDACVLGDDYLGLMRFPVNTAHWSQWVEDEAKMKLTGSTPQLSGEATLLSRRLCVDTEVPCMMPKLGKALARFNVRVSNNEAISDSAYMAGKALSYAYEFRHFPIFRDLFINRYRSEEDAAKIDLTEVSWFTKTSGALDVADLESSIMNEKVLVSEDCTREFLMDAYGYSFGLEDAKRISERIILGTDLEVVIAPPELEIDWE